MLKGVLDRIEDQKFAVILIEEIKEQFVVPVHKLPEGSVEGTWFNIDKRDNEFHIIEIDEEATHKEAEKSKDLLAQLRARSSGSQYKRK